MRAERQLPKCRKVVKNVHEAHCFMNRAFMVTSDSAWSLWQLRKPLAPRKKNEKYISQIIVQYT